MGVVNRASQASAPERSTIDVPAWGVTVNVQELRGKALIEFQDLAHRTKALDRESAEARATAHQFITHCIVNGLLEDDGTLACTSQDERDQVDNFDEESRLIVANKIIDLTGYGPDSENETVKI